MKLTNKTTKQEMMTFLDENFKVIQKADKTLADQIIYTAKAYKKDEKSVTATDLRGLVKDSQKLLAEKVKEAPAASVRPSGKKSTLKANPKATEEKSVVKEEPKAENTPKETPKSAVAGKKKDEVKTDTPSSKKVIPLAKQFPETLTLEDGEFSVAHDLKEMKDLLDAINNDETIIFAFYWTKRHLKQFSPYMDAHFDQPKQFDNDLDLAYAVVISDSLTVAYAMSAYTEAMYSIFPDEVAEDEEDGVRFSNGIEYQIYRLNK